jgi:virginiamycin B lyase
MTNFAANHSRAPARLAMAGAATLGMMLLAACAPKAPPAQAAPPQAAATAAPTLSGLVQSADQSPLAGATVYATEKASGIITSTHSGADGRFVLPLRGGGDYLLSASKKGWRAGEARALAVAPGAVDAGAIALTRLEVVPGGQLNSADILPGLPELDTPAGARIGQSCSQCHSISALLARGGRSRDEWTAMVALMGTVAGGYFPIREEYQKEYVNWLVKHLGPGSKLPEEIGRKVAAQPPALPTGSDLVYTEYEIPSAMALAHTAVPDQRGSVWFASFGVGKVGRLDVASGKITEYPTRTPGLHPHGITVSPEGIVWFSAMPYGIGRIDPATGELQEFKAPDPTESARGSPHTIIVARDGKVWFTELTNGSITSFDPKTQQFRRYQIEERSGPYGILEREDNVFWFILSGASKVGVLDANTGKVRTWPTPTPKANPQRFRFAADGRIWFGEYGAGKIGVFDPKTEQMTEYDLPYGGSAYCIHLDASGEVWIASTRRESLIRFDPVTKAMSEYPLPGAGADDDVLGPIVRDIWPDAEGRMWFVEWSRNKVASAALRRP